MGQDEQEDTTVYKVVVNHEEQYSIWPSYRENPLGWQDAGKTGLKELAELNYDKAEFAKDVISRIPGVVVKKSSPTFNEFTVCLPRNADDVVHRMVEKGFAAGFPLGRFYKGLDKYLLVAVTEKRSREEILKYKDSLEAILCD